jgi:PAS domain S-box-containing protein
MHRSLRDFLDSFSDWVWEMDVNGVHTYSNGAVREILGYEPEDLIGRHVSMFWPEEFATPERIATFNEELKEGLAWQHFRGRFRHRNGDLKILESSGEPLFDARGALVGFRGIDRDIASTLQHEAELEQSKADYKALSERLRWENDFKLLLLDIISHDILNPVNVLSGMSEMLMDEYPGNEKIEMIQRSSHRLTKVIASARDLTQLSLGESLSVAPTRLVELVNQASSEFDVSLKQMNMRLKVDIPEALVIQSNPILVEIFKNYISNVFKYEPETKVIHICAEEDAEGLRVEVRDEGTPLPEADRERIFQRGTRLAPGKKGSGLGLAIVKRIAEAHHARVGVRPAGSKGNAFYIIFPGTGKNTKDSLEQKKTD